MRWEKAHILQDYINTGKVEYDFAVVELSTNLGDQVGWSGYGYDNNLNNGDEITIIGYPGDKESGTMWSVRCPADFYNKEIRHRCDTYGGMSGSGIKARNSKGEVSIYGIHTFGSTSVNGGVRFDQEHFEIVKNWKYGNDVAYDQTRTNSRPTQDHDKIYFRNKCNKTIWTALHYVDLDGDWVTDGWWEISPGDTTYVANTRNTIYYIHAQTNNGTTWTGDYNFRIRGKGPYGFKKKEITTSKWGKWTQSFSCN